jgi:hypothetical protein
LKNKIFGGMMGGMVHKQQLKGYSLKMPDTPGSRRMMGNSGSGAISICLFACGKMEGLEIRYAN